MKFSVINSRKFKVRSPRFRVKNAQQKVKNEKLLNHASKHCICYVKPEED